METDVRDGVLQLAHEGTRWLSTAPAEQGGVVDADAAYNATVPEGFDRTDLTVYARERRDAAGFDTSGPTLLTGVAMRHARGARRESVTAVATVGLSNPARLVGGERAGTGTADGDRPPVGTVNLLVGTDCSLDDGALATLLSVVVEAKTAALLDRAGFPGTTSDAVVVGTDPAGDPTEFAGSATPVGRAARVCVRDAVRAAFDARYAESDPPATVADAAYGVVTDERAETFTPCP